MVKPPRLPVLLDGAALQARRGITAADITRQLTEGKAAPRPISARQEQRHKRIRDVVDKCLAILDKAGKGLVLGGTVCSSWNEAVTRPISVWTAGVIGAMLLFYAGTARAGGGRRRITRLTLQGFAMGLLAVLRRAYSPHGVPREVRLAVPSKLDLIATQARLPERLPFKARITIADVLLLLREADCIQARGRRLVSLLTYMGVACSTGLRVGSLLRELPVTDTAQLFPGLQWSEVTLWAVANPSKDGENDIVAYITILHAKNFYSRGTSFPLRATPYLGLSAGHMLLLAAELDGILQAEVPEVLDPAFLKPSGRPRRLGLDKRRQADIEIWKTDADMQCPHARLPHRRWRELNGRLRPE